jgi:uncharacterized protein
MRHTPLLALALLAACGGVVAQPVQNAPEAAAAPAPAERVMDAAHLLSPEQANGIAALSASLEQRTRHQFIVVTVTSLDGQDIAEYSTALGNRLGVGRKGINDGVMLVVAPNERKVRIAVGAGLRKQLTDGEAKAIVDQTLIPSFKAGHFDEGIVKGSDRIVAELSETGA